MKTKRFLSVFLAVLMILSAIPVASMPAFALEDGVALTKVEDTISSEMSERHIEHETAFTFTEGEVPAGSYYLEDDLFLTGPLYITGQVDLCLNGKMLNLNGDGYLLASGEDAVLNIYDCNEDTVHKFRAYNEKINEDDEETVYVYRIYDEQGDYEVAGGIITGANYDGENAVLTAEDGATINVYKATIIGNLVSASEMKNGGVAKAKNRGTFNMYSGRIFSNVICGSRDNVACSLLGAYGGTMYIGSLVEISDNLIVASDSDSSKPFANLFYAAGATSAGSPEGVVTVYATIDSNRIISELTTAYVLFNCQAKGVMNIYSDITGQYAYYVVYSFGKTYIYGDITGNELGKYGIYTTKKTGTEQECIVYGTIAENTVENVLISVGSGSSMVLNGTVEANVAGENSSGLIFSGSSASLEVNAPVRANVSPKYIFGNNGGYTIINADVSENTSSTSSLCQVWGGGTTEINGTVSNNEAKTSIAYASEGNINVNGDLVGNATQSVIYYAAKDGGSINITGQTLNNTSTNGILFAYSDASIVAEGLIKGNKATVNGYIGFANKGEIYITGDIVENELDGTALSAANGGVLAIAAAVTGNTARRLAQAYTGGVVGFLEGFRTNSNTYSAASDLTIVTDKSEDYDMASMVFLTMPNEPLTVRIDKELNGDIDFENFRIFAEEGVDMAELIEMLRGQNGISELYYDEQTGEVVYVAHKHEEAQAVRENEVDSTCTAEGSYDMVVYCAKCGLELSRETFTIEMKEHEGAQAVIENTVDATCTAQGSYDEVVYCKDCNKELSRQTMTIAMKDHVIVIDKAVLPGCYETGLTLGSHCKDCGLVIVAQQVVPARGHVPVVSEIAIAPTCFSEGRTATVVCKDCGEVLEMGQVLATVDHADEDKDGQCDMCGGFVKNDYCTCICHGHKKIHTILYKIVRVFWKTFGMKRTCQCGMAHN